MSLTAHEVGLDIHPDATGRLPARCCQLRRCGYHGGGAVIRQDRQADQITLFIDVGTNGEIVLGSTAIGW